MEPSGSTFEAVLEETHAWLRLATAASGRDTGVMAADVADMRMATRELERALAEAISGKPDWDEFVAALHGARIELVHFLSHWRSLAGQIGDSELLQTDEY